MSKKTTQNTIIIMCWLIYSLAYLGRYSYNANITLIINDYGVSKAQAGLVATFFFFAYGIGQVVNGILSGRYNKKWLFPIALVLSSLINLTIFFGVPFSALKYLWFLNGFVQSCLWSGLISVISKTVDDKNMERAMLLMGTTTCVGTVATYSFGALFAFLNNYRLSFLLGALVMTVIGVIWFVIYSPELEVNRNDKKTGEVAVEKKWLNGFVAILVLLSFIAIIDNLLKDGLTTWVPDILKERYGKADSLSILLSTVLPLLGVFGSVISIWLNKYIKNFITLSTVLFAIGAVATWTIAGFDNINVIFAVICFGIVVCMMHGVNNIVTSLAPLKMRNTVNSGKVAGIMNGFAYVGSTLSSYGLGRIADIGGWQMCLNLLLAIMIITILIGIAYTVFSRQKNI